MRDILAAMRQDAQRLGRKLVDLEAELDHAFRTGEITPARLARMTSEIAAVEGQLRNTHLAAHLETKTTLTPEQVAHYDQLRGYATTSGVPPAGSDTGGGHHGGEHSGH